MFFVLDENNNKVEALDKEGVFAALEKAIADGSLTELVADSAFVSKLKCCVTGQTNRIAFVTEAKYNEMVAAGTVENGVYYYITDDTSIETIDEALKALDGAVTDLNGAILSIEKRLDALGFKEGVAEYTEFTSIFGNSLKKQGKYVIFNFAANLSAQTTGIIIIPKEFRPKSDTTIIARGYINGSIPFYEGVSLTVEAATGAIVCTAGASSVLGFEITNSGWETV